jgi:hypothetical protein
MRTPKLLSALPGKMSQIRTLKRGRRKPRQPEAVEDLKLAVRDDVVWPVQDAFLALRNAGRSAILGAAVLVLMVAVGGYALVSFDSSQPEAPTPPVAAASKPTSAAKPAAVKAAPKPAPAPTLQGATPVFKAPKKAKQSKKGAGSKAATAASAAPVATGNSGNAATDTISSTPSAPAAEASTASTSVKGPPAGPAAIAVARKFAGAFVVYETGGTDTTVRRAFKATATPGVTKALLQRPPHQPAGVKVPKAKVLNVVPAPSHDRIYPISVSLLRVGATSELRLELEQLKNKQWRVANVLG